LKPDIDQVTGKASESGTGKSSNRLFVFIICLGISMFIWFLIVLSRESFTTIDYPIVFENNPGNMVLINSSDSILSLNVSSGGLTLITLKYISRRTPVKIDLKNLDLIRDGYFYSARISTADVSKKIIDRLNLPEEHISVSPEMIFLKFESMSGMKVKVVPKLILEFEKQYQLSEGLKVIPDSVTIIGPKDELSKIGFIETIRKEVKKINESQTVSVLLALPENAANIRCIPEKVDVVLSVDKFTESAIEIPIKFSDPDIKIRTYPDRVKITYFVSLKDFNRVHEDMFLARVTPEKENLSSKLKTEILQYPSFIKIIKVEPEEVEFLLLK
jgi:hypothetical protein